MYKFLNIEYDRESLIELFSSSKKSNIKSLYQVTQPLIGHKCIDDLFYQLPFISHNEHNVELGQLRTYVKPYISPGNNGLVVIPLEGEMLINFYSYPGTRETLNPIRMISSLELESIKSTLIDTVIINRPFIFNGLVPHDYCPIDGTTTIAILKIPLDVSWDSINLV